MRINKRILKVDKGVINMNKAFIIKETNRAINNDLPKIINRMRKYDKDNFYFYTKANFKEIEIPIGNPDYTSNSGSQYYYSENGIIRVSNHWGYSIASCEWLLNKSCSSELKAGYCDWNAFNFKYLKEPTGTNSQLGKRPIDWKN